MKAEEFQKNSLTEIRVTKVVIIDRFFFDLCSRVSDIVTHELMVVICAHFTTFFSFPVANLVPVHECHHFCLLCSQPGEEHWNICTLVHNCSIIHFLLADLVLSQ